MSRLNEFLDCNFGADGESVLRQMLSDGEFPNQAAGPDAETPLHVATRRRRLAAVEILLNHGAKINAKNLHGKTAYAHAIRRGFNEVADLLRDRGADTTLNLADQLAVATVNGRLDEARKLLKLHPEIVRTGNPEEDRLLADVAGRNPTEPVKMLIEAGANVAAPALDGGSPLHQAAWFGQPANARLLIDAGAPLNVFDPTHNYSPLGWAVHGSRYSGDANERQEAYIALVKMLLDAGSQLHYPDRPNDNDYFRHLQEDAPDEILDLLLEAKRNND
jgi:ankyrin repeat protein